MSRSGCLNYLCSCQTYSNSDGTISYRLSGCFVATLSSARAEPVTPFKKPEFNVYVKNSLHKVIRWSTEKSCHKWCKTETFVNCVWGKRTSFSCELCLRQKEVIILRTVSEIKGRHSLADCVWDKRTPFSCELCLRQKDAILLRTVSATKGRHSLMNCVWQSDVILLCGLCLRQKDAILNLWVLLFPLNSTTRSV